MTFQTTHLHDLFGSIVGTEHIWPASAADAVDGQQPALVVAPGSAEEAAAVLRAANEADLAVIPRGGGTKLAWGNVPRGADIVLSTERLNRLVEHAHGDMTATAEAGMAIAALQAALARHGQMLALDPAWPAHATLGGVVAADASGPLRVRYGTVRDLLIGISVALPDGTLAKGGGKVVKNVAGYDLMKLFTGSLGTLGLITSVTLRLHPLPHAVTSLLVHAPTAAAAEAFVLRINESTFVPTGVQIVSEAEGYGIYVRFGGVEASVVAQSRDLVKHAQQSGLAARMLDEDESRRGWQAHATIYDDPAEAVVARISVLPASIGATLEMLATVAGRLRVARQVVIQATGTGIVRFESPNEQALAAATGVARARITELGGTLVVHHFPAASKAQFDVWGTGGDALPLMRRVKAQFDPRGILNPGRYVGRI